MDTITTIIAGACFGNAIAWAFDPIQDLKYRFIPKSFTEGNRLKRIIHKLLNCAPCASWWSAIIIGVVSGHSWTSLILGVCSYVVGVMISKVNDHVSKVNP